jgi:Protein of unknown function (DUF3147)
VGDAAAVTGRRWPLGVSAAPSRLRQCRLRDYLIRFVFGGVVTVVAGVIATGFGPGVGGLWLAFPAILPASLTLIAQHARNSPPAGADAYGAVFGSVGLLAFAAVVWWLAPSQPAWLVLALALLAWPVAGCGSWAVAEKLRRARRQRRNATAAATSRPGRGLAKPLGR